VSRSLGESQPALSPARRRRWRRWVRAVALLVALGILVAGLAGLGWLRIDARTGRIVLGRPPLFLQEPGFERTGHRYLYDPQLGWRNIPHWRASTGGQPLTINSGGLRGPEVSLVKPPDVRRILVLGDSYAWGYGVADQEVFPFVLQQQLNGDSVRWQVLNGGVSGWGTDQQYLFLKYEGLAYAPDIVVVALFTGNDFANNSATNQYTLNKPVLVDEQLHVANVPVPRPGQRASSGLDLKMSQLDPIQLTVEILRGISRLCQQQHCNLVIMKFGTFLAPDSDRVRREEARFHRAWQTAGLPAKYLDLDESFRVREIDAWQILRGNDDGHWNARGHREVATILHEFLRDAGMVQ